MIVHIFPGYGNCLYGKVYMDSIPVLICDDAKYLCCNDNKNVHYMSTEGKYKDVPIDIENGIIVLTF